MSFVDIAVRPPAPAELRRFATRLGGAALLDEAGRAYRDQGLAYLRMDEEEIVEKIGRDARLLRLPLVRMGDRLTVGPSEPDWRAWLSEV